MWPYQVSNLGPLAIEPDALPTALCGLTEYIVIHILNCSYCDSVSTGKNLNMPFSCLS